MGCFLFPSTPDMGAAAQQQGAANKETAIAQSNLNNPNMYTPFGSQVYTEGATPESRPTLTQTLSPAEQQKLDLSNQAGISSLNILNSAMPMISDQLSQPFGLSGTPLQGGYNPAYASQAGTQFNPGSYPQMQMGLNFAGAPPMPVASDQTREAVTQSLYDQGARFLDPQYAQMYNDLTVNLANQGITRGSEGAQTALDDYARAQTIAYGDLRDRSISGGIGAMQNLYGMAMQGRQQGVGEIATQGEFLNQAQRQYVDELLARMGARNAAVTGQYQVAGNEAGLEGQQRGQLYNEYAANRTMPLNMLAALMQGGQVNVPQFQQTQPTSITPPNYYQAALDQYNMKQGQAQSLLNAGVGLGSAWLMRPSDRRLKSNIEFVCRLPSGLGWYQYDIEGRREFGVMADEVEKVFPEAVSIGEDGFQRVDYSKVR